MKIALKIGHYNWSEYSNICTEYDYPVIFINI